MSRARGFSLLELLLVMALLAMAAAVVMPAIGGDEVLLLQRDVRELSAILKHARRGAIVEGRGRQVHFYIDDAKEAAPETSRRNGEGRWFNQGADVKWEALKKDKKPSRKDKSDDETPVVHFYPGGGSSGGTLKIQRGEQRAQIKINPLTGRLDITLPGDKT